MTETDFDFRLPDGREAAAAVFDLDETLIHGDSTLDWTDWLYRSGTTSDPRYRQVAVEMAHRYREGTLDIHWFVRETAPAVAHLTPLQFNALLTRFVRETVLPKAYPEGAAVIRAAKRRGIPVLIISATVSFIVKPVAEGLGVEEAIGVDVAFRDGIPTGEIVGTPSFRDGKVTRLREWGKAHGIRPEDVIFFTDSRNDLPLAREAGHCAVVNPDDVLRQEALLKGWPILSWGAQAH